MSAEESGASSDDWEYDEITDERRIKLPPPSVLVSWTASRLVSLISAFGRDHDLGEAVTNVLFDLRLPRLRMRRPDGAFVSFARWPRHRPMSPHAECWDVVPDLAIEVVDPNEYAEDVLEKIDEYFKAGVTLVWVVYPIRKLFYVYESPTHLRGLTANKELDGGPVLPGFRLPLAEFFIDVSDANKST